MVTNSKFQFLKVEDDGLQLVCLASLWAQHLKMYFLQLNIFIFVYLFFAFKEQIHEENSYWGFLSTNSFIQISKNEIRSAIQSALGMDVIWFKLSP